MLHEFITLNRDELIGRCRAKVTARIIPTPTESEINHGVPIFLDQLVEVLRHHETGNPEMQRNAALHGQDLLKQGFTVGQVVHDYGDVCQAITELAMETDARINPDEFRMLNQFLDDAIADAVTAYGHDRNQATLAEESARGRTQTGFFAHELRNLVQTITVAFEVLKKGNVGLAGSTAAVISRNLIQLHSLVDKSIADVRMTSGIQHSAAFSASQFIEELAQEAKLFADNRDVTLKVVCDDKDADVQGDRQNLAAAITNLLQNAVKFTRPGSTVTLKSVVSGDRILIEVQDECGGLPDGKSAELFHPFEQRGADRTGLGLGLAYSQWAVVANGGRIFVRNLPGAGCVFVADLPRGPSQVMETQSASVSVATTVGPTISTLTEMTSIPVEDETDEPPFSRIGAGG